MGKKISQITTEEASALSDNDVFEGEESGGTSFKVLWSVIKATIAAATMTLTNKTLTTPTIADFTNAAHDHGDADDGGAIVSSSEAVSGVIELATNAETLAGTDTVRAVTPNDLHYVMGRTWVAATGTWSYSSADSPSFVASVPDADAAMMTVGDRLLITQTTNKFFIVTAIGSPSGGFTPVTMYGGTDYTLANASITAAYWSHAKAPLGFPLNPDKWTVKVTDTSDRTQSTPTQNTWYNLGSITISIPIGAWFVDWKAAMYALINGTAVNQFSTLSTANNSESDGEFTAEVLNQGATSTSLGALATPNIRKPLVVAAKTSYFLNARTNLASVTSIAHRGDIVTTVVKAVCAYL